jgi:hypothetical protein
MGVSREAAHLANKRVCVAQRYVTQSLPCRTEQSWNWSFFPERSSHIAILWAKVRPGVARARPPCNTREVVRKGSFFEGSRISTRRRRVIHVSRRESLLVRVLIRIQVHGGLNSHIFSNTSSSHASITRCMGSSLLSSRRTHPTCQGAAATSSEADHLLV